MTTKSLGDDLRSIADWLAGHSGISTGIIGVHSLKRAMDLRLRSTGLPTPSAYLEHLLESVEEQQCLVELVVVPETWFFRDRHPFIHLRDHIARMLQGAQPSQPLRLLSAPCATGEEPYSMAMTLLDMGLPHEAFSIDAIDICRQSIRKARNGVYAKHSFRGVSAAEQQQHFQSTPQGLALNPEIRQSVHFKRSNLMHCLAETGSLYDVIFCRNLLIYLEETASQHLLESLARLMRPGALLIVGSAETGKVPTALFTPIRESFVFGFLRKDFQAIAPSPSEEPPRPASPKRRERPAVGRSAKRTTPRSAARVATRPPLADTTSPPAAPAARRRSPGSPASLPAGSTSGSGAVDSELERCEQEIAHNPYSDAAYLQLAQLQERRKRPEEALASLQKSLYLRPDSREALTAMIRLTKQLGHLERSRQFQGRLARLEP